MIRLTSQLGT